MAAIRRIEAGAADRNYRKGTKGTRNLTKLHSGDSGY